MRAKPTLSTGPALAFVALTAAGTSYPQTTILESKAWAPVPTEGTAPMGAFAEQQVPFFNGPNPMGAGCISVIPPAAAPPGICGPTLWHTEPDCCAAGAGYILPMSAPAAAYNQGDLGVFDYLTLGPGGVSLRNAGALSSVGLRGVPIRPFPVIVPPEQILLTFDTVKETEGMGVGTFDECWIEARSSTCGELPCVDGAGAAWAGFVKLTGNFPCAAPLTCTIGPLHPVLDASFIGSDGKIRFRFDSIDPFTNSYCGWMVDNVRLTNEKCDPPCGPVSPFQPQIGSTGGMPRPGNPAFALTLSAAPPGSPTLLLLGIQKNFISLPALGLPSPGCTVCCDPTFILAAPTTNAAGNTMIPLPIPAGIAPCASVCAQWLVPSFAGGGIALLASSKGDIGVQP